MELYNVKSRTKDVIDDPEVLKEAILTGSHAFKSGAGVTVKSPSGEMGTVPAENIAEAINAGYQVETPSQKIVREYVDKNKNLGGALKVGLGQFADETLMGIPELILDKTGDPLEVAKREALKKEHELANIFGGVGGFAASTVLGGPLFKGAATAGNATAKATSAVATKLGAAAGVDVGKNTLARVARDIVSKTAGGAVEGALISAPHAITEAALGDPSDASESLLAGAGIGSVLGGGGVLAKGLFNLGAQGTNKVLEKLGQQKENAQSVAAKLAKVFTGVDENAIKYYAENAERVNLAPSVEALKNSIDDVVLQARDKVTIAKEVANNTKRELDDSYRALTFDLSRARAPEELSTNLMSALNEQKSVLGRLSDEADDILVSSGATFKKADLLNFVDKLGMSVGAGQKKALIGDEAVSAVNKLKTMRDRIEGGLTEEIDAVTLRDVLRQVRKDINYNQAAGEFNDTLNKLKKEFTGRVSDVLKGKSPEYKAMMERMAGLSDNLEEMSKAFGTREKAIGSLNNLMSAKGKVKDDLLTKFSELTGKDWQAELAEFKRAKELLEKSKRQDVRGELLPELSKKYQQALEDLAKAEDAFAPLRRLSPESTQNAIRQQAFKTPNIENRKAFEAASEVAGRDFLTEMKDRAVLDAFSKETTNGSRKAVMFGTLGGMIGGWPGSAVGSAVGGALDIYGGPVMKTLLDTNRNVSGLLFSEQAMKRTAKKLDEIPEILKGMSKKKSVPLRTLGTDALFRIQDKRDEEPKKETSVQERLKKLRELNEKTSVLVSNPDLMIDRIGSLASGISAGGAPNIGGAFSAKMTNALMYLNSQMPKPPKPKNAFAPRMEWRPSDYELSKFEHKVNVLEDPFVVLRELENGTLTKSHMEALQAVYPGLHRMISERIAEAATSEEIAMDYDQRMKLGLVLGQSLDDSTTPQSISYYQSTFIQPDETEAGPDEMGSGGGGSGEFKASVNMAEGLATNTQRVAARNVI